MQKQRILDLFRASGDANLGQTLSRLARLAAAVHRFEHAGLTPPGAGVDRGAATSGTSTSVNASMSVLAAAGRDSMEDAR